MTLRRTGIGMTSQRTRQRLVDRLREAGIKDERVLAQIYEMPRHIFVDEALASRAYEDTPLPIGFSQTISSPYIVARMTELVRNGRQQIDRILEIGTGCGYQTAILARFAKEVYSIERIEALLTKARTHLRELKVNNIRFKHGDGSLGLPEVSPFDGIVVTAAAVETPAELVAQLGLGGRLVFPKGHDEQRLYVVERTDQGVAETMLEPVKFVPLLPGAIRA
ncbi:MAG: protein-L-isoaspartate(D-aspartate) O-methyltransferase [Burkholderiales bacterium]